MKVLHIIPTLKKGGAERLAIDICNALNRLENVDCRLIYFYPGNDYKFLLNDLDHQLIPAKYIPSISGKAIVEVDKLATFINDFQPDLIHSHLFEAELVARAVKYSKAVYFSHCHDNMPPFTSFSLKTLFNKNRLLRLYEKSCLLKMYRQTGGNNFIAISNDTHRFFKENLPSDLQNIALLLNAINVSLFLSKKIRQAPSELLKLVTVGSLVDKKNQIFLIEVIKLLKSKNIKVKLDMLGDGPNRSQIQKRIETEDLQNEIQLHGIVDHVEHFLWDAHIYVHSATYEPFGLVLVEAMAAGLPVVTLDGKGNRDLIKEGENGFMIYDSDPRLFVEKIINLKDDKLQYLEISKYAVNFSRQFDIDTYAHELMKLYQTPKRASASYILKSKADTLAARH